MSTYAVKRRWYLKNKELVKQREEKRKEKKRATQEYKEKMFIHKLKSYHNKIVVTIRKPRNKNFNAKEYLKSYRVEYEKKNKEKIREYKRVRNNERYKEDVNFKLAKVMRSRLRAALKASRVYKNNSTMTYVWCTKEELIVHLESQFTEWMTWENYWEWHIDHIHPISKFDLTIEEEIHKAMHYTNLQPLWAIENIKKWSKIPNLNSCDVCDFNRTCDRLSFDKA